MERSVVAPSRLVRDVALTGLAGVVAGLIVGGIGGRVVMRLAAMAAGPEARGILTEAGNTVGEITLEGTFGLIFGGVFSGAAGAVVVVIADPWLAWMRRLRCIGYGMVVLAVAGTLILDSSNRDFFVLSPAELNVAMFVGLFFGYGIVLQAARAVLDRRLPTAASGPQPGYLGVVALGVPFLFLVLATFTVPGLTEGRPPLYGVGALLVLMGLATLGYWISIIAHAPRWLELAAPLVGFGSLAILLVVGLPRLMAEIGLIL
ncbi:MAG TPA: hypothetical protein VIL12_00510 [Acidimicrobiia bacterium]